MDILVSSNLERLLYNALDNDASAVVALMAQLKETGRYALPEKAMARIRERFVGACADDEAALAAIGRVFKETGYVMDPHTAVAWRAAEDCTRADVPCVVLSTASPFKFPASVLRGLGAEVPEDAGAQTALLEKLSGEKAPASLAGVLEREVRFKDVIDPNDMMQYVLGKAARA